jgi:hypothetical protein
MSEVVLLNTSNEGFRCPPISLSGYLRLRVVRSSRRQFCSQLPRQELVDTVDRVIDDTLHDVAQVNLRIESVELGCAN